MKVDYHFIIADKVTGDIVKDCVTAKEAMLKLNLHHRNTLLDHCKNHSFGSGRLYGRFVGEYIPNEPIGKGKPVLFLDTESKELSIFSSTGEASREIMINRDSLNRAIKYGKRFYGRYIIRYLNYVGEFNKISDLIKDINDQEKQIKIIEQYFDERDNLKDGNNAADH